MALLPAEWDGSRYINPVPTKVGGLSLMFKMGPRFFFGAAARAHPLWWAQGWYIGYHPTRLEEGPSLFR